MTRISQPTDDYLATLSVPQLTALLKSHKGRTTEIESIILTNRVMVRLLDLKGERFVEKLMEGKHG